MTDYIKEIEAQVESLKANLERERDWIDYLNKRKDSQKYRRWCLKFVVRHNNIPAKISNKVPLRYCFVETVHHTLADARHNLRIMLNEIVEEYYADWIRVKHKSIKGKLKPSVQIRVSICLFNQRKDVEVYEKNIDMTMIWGGQEYGARIIRVNGLEPGNIQEIDEIILPFIHPDDEYINKWAKREDHGGIRETN